MDYQFLRQERADKLSSPEQLNDYLQVAGTGVWITLAAVILLLAGAIFWASVTTVNSTVSCTAEFRNGMITVVFADDVFADKLRVGQEVDAGGTQTALISVGKREDGRVTATAYTSLADGQYPAEAVYSRTRLIEMMFN